MINLNNTLILISAFLLFAFGVNANESKLHANKTPTKATINTSCSSFNKMVESGAKNDMSEIIMLAMIKKCKNQKIENENDSVSSHYDSDANMSDEYVDEHADEYVDEHADEDASNHGQGNAQENGQGNEMKCGGAMNNTSKKVENKVEDHDGHNQ